MSVVTGLYHTCGIEPLINRKLERNVESLVEEKNDTLLGVEEYDLLIRSCADETMERKLKRRTCEDNRTREPIWTTEEIRCQIKNRRELNRRQRNCNAENREENWGRHLQQKELVKQMIRKGLGEHETGNTRN